MGDKQEGASAGIIFASENDHRTKAYSGQDVFEHEVFFRSSQSKRRLLFCTIYHQ